MSKEDVIRMALEAGAVTTVARATVDGGDGIVFVPDELERFAKLVYEKAWADTALAATHTVTDAAIALEREACAKMCEEIDPPLDSSATAMACAWAIRARSNP